MLQAEADPQPERPLDEHFRAIYRAEFEFVWVVARRFGVPPAAQEDAVQEVFLAAFRHLASVRYEVSPRAWLFTLTRRVASRYHRTSARATRRVAAFAAATADAVAVPHARHDAALQLAQMLGHLSEGTRTVWELTEVHGMSGPEIAAELGLPLNTVYSRLRLARAQLAALTTDTVAAGIAAARRHDLPPAGAARRVWSLLVPMLLPGGVAVSTAGTTWATSHPVAALMLAGAAVTAGLAVVQRSPLVDDPLVVRADDPVAPPIPSAPLPPASPAAAPPPPAITTPDDHLAAEVALLDRIRGHLDARDVDAALAVIARHARTFPAGALRDAREAARVEALCLRGDLPGAEAAAARLLETMPDSLIARRFAHHVCAP